MKKFVLVCLVILAGALSFAAPMIVKSEFIITNDDYKKMAEVIENSKLYERDYKEVTFDDWTEALDKFQTKNRNFPMYFVNTEKETAIYEARWTEQYIIVKVIYIKDNTNNLGEMYEY